ncbi:MAG: ion transporter [Candidatus Methanoperedens sp.]|nr:ion transporter [Candidatus Methanoperedens sp.]MCZ7370269.1 ion transporter [Candidatus Methanoperedens sp.]
MQSLRAKLREPVYQILTDHLMIVLALILIPVIFLPALFTFSQFMLALFRAVRDAILVIFILEYFLKLYVADSRKAYATEPWHIIDLLIAILAATNFIPRIPLGGIGRIFPLLRVARIFAVAGRTVKRAIPVRPMEKVTPLVSQMKINILEDGRIIKGAAKEDIARYIAAPGHIWIDLQEVSELDIGFLSDTLKIPGVVLESKIIKESYPKIDFFKNLTTIFIRDYKLRSEDADTKTVQILRNNMLIAWADNYIVTISNNKSELFDLINDGLSVKDEDFIVRILYSIFSRKISDYEEIVRSMEQDITALEELPVGQMHPFLERSFYFKREIQKIHSNLLHFRQVLGAVRTRKMLPGLKDEYPSLFGILFDESVYLSETSDTIRDNLISLIDLRINTVSVGLNRVMRILAVITSLGLIPSIISGLFGENLIDSPYPVRLSEIFFLELSIMLLALYVFYRRGWLR